MQSHPKSSFYHLRNISRIRKYLTKETAAVAVHAFVTLKLDFCNALLYGLLKYQLQRLQLVQNMVARVVCQMSKFQHITPVLQELHWQPIQYCVIFKILFLVNKSLNGALRFQKLLTASPKLDKNSYLNTRREALKGITWLNLSISLLSDVIFFFPCDKVQCPK